jgi:hypothetical protein
MRINTAKITQRRCQTYPDHPTRRNSEDMLVRAGCPKKKVSMKRVTMDTGRIKDRSRIHFHFDICSE